MNISRERERERRLPPNESNILTAMKSGIFNLRGIFAFDSLTQEIVLSMMKRQGTTESLPIAHSAMISLNST